MQLQQKRREKQQKSKKHSLEGKVKWEPKQIDKDWRYLSKEEFCAKYPDEARFYGPPPPEDKFVW